MTDKEIGEIIRDQRQKKNLSQVELARKVGVTWEMISRYERGKSSALNKLQELAFALEVPMGTFFGAVPTFANFRDASAERLQSIFLPIISTIPTSKAELVRMLSQLEQGMYLYDDGSAVEKFAIKLGPDSKIRIAAGVLLPRGILVCTLATEELDEHSLVLTVVNNLVQVTQYTPESKANVLAKVVEWVVKF